MIRKNFWKYSAIVFALLMIASFYYNPFHKDSSISKGDIADITGNFLTNYILGPNHDIKIKEINEKDYFYTVKLEIDGKNAESYLSKDGKFFFPQGFNIFTIEQTSKFTEYKEVNVREHNPSMGNENALVTVVEFSDYQCGFCSSFNVDTFDKVKENYIDTGYVKFVHKHFPLERIHQLSFKSAEAAACAQEQGKFWEYHKMLFKNMFELTNDDLKKYAEKLELNTEEFNSCLDSGKMEAKVKEDMTDGEALGITGTPIFFINGREVSGAQSYEVFAQTIEDEMARALNPNA